MGAREARKGGKRRTRRSEKEDAHVHTVSACVRIFIGVYTYMWGSSGGNKSFTSKDTRRERIFTVQEDRAVFLLGPAPFLFDKIYLNRASSDCALLPSLPFLHRLAFAVRSIYIAIGAEQTHGLKGDTKATWMCKGDYAGSFPYVGNVECANHCLNYRPFISRDISNELYHHVSWVDILRLTDYGP